MLWQYLPTNAEALTYIIPSWLYALCYCTNTLTFDYVGPFRLSKNSKKLYAFVENHLLRFTFTFYKSWAHYAQYYAQVSELCLNLTVLLEYIYLYKIFNTVSVLLEYIDLFKYFLSNTSYYAGIMLDAFRYLLCSKLCRYNWRKPSNYEVLNLFWIYTLVVVFSFFSLITVACEFCI